MGNVFRLLRLSSQARRGGSSASATRCSWERQLWGNIGQPTLRLEQVGRPHTKDVGLRADPSDDLACMLEVGQRGIDALFPDDRHDATNAYEPSFTCTCRQVGEAATLVDPEHFVREMRWQCPQ